MNLHFKLGRLLAPPLARDRSSVSAAMATFAAVAISFSIGVSAHSFSTSYGKLQGKSGSSENLSADRSVSQAASEATNQGANQATNQGQTVHPAQSASQGPVLQLQLALTDLQLVLGWSTQRDLTWSMVKNQYPHILAYLQQQLVLHDAKRQPLACGWQSEFAAWKLTQIQQQYYLQLPIYSNCPTASWLHYQLLMQLHEHKMLMQTPHGEQILAEANPWLAL